MHQRKTLLSLTLALALAATGALAAEAEHDQHHPGATAPATATPAPSTPGMPMGPMPGGSGNMPMGMGMMGGMQQGGQPQAGAQQGGMPSMCMMGGMAQGGQGTSMQPMGMMGQNGMGGHVEGRIAFLKTELKITDAQQSLWNAVADAMRAIGTAAKDHPVAMGCMGMNTPGTLPEKLAARDNALTAHLDALRKLRTALDPLYAALSADQKKTADSMVIGPMGVMGMGMM